MLVKKEMYIIFCIIGSEWSLLPLAVPVSVLESYSSDADVFWGHCELPLLLFFDLRQNERRQGDLFL
jgi:hypothetical protein